MSATVAELAEFLSARRAVSVISGAGCSTASGIGDYRDADGAWKRSAPIQMQDFVRDPRARRRYWARSMLGWPRIARARTNPAHRALAALEAAGIVRGLITQNVDGLHQLAGHRHVIELHGRLADVICLDCGARTSRAALQERLEADNGWLTSAAAPALPDGDADLADTIDLAAFQVPECTSCGGVLKPDVVFYGDSVPRDRVAACHALVDAADALFVVGSSLMVYSSFRFCRRAHERGIPIVAVNRGVTRADPLLALKVEEDCTSALPGLAEVLAEGDSPVGATSQSRLL
jgi:NAD-dependent SIR2 family protein deacetylase